jgi:hypothetical protein
VKTHKLLILKYRKINIKRTNGTRIGTIGALQAQIKHKIGNKYHENGHTAELEKPVLV